MATAEGTDPAEGTAEEAAEGVPWTRKRTGRRPGTTLSRVAILQAAQSRFAAHGYAGASIRAIAQDAGVDAALVHHFFVSKEKLFAASIHDALNPESVVEAVLAGGSRVGGTGQRLMRAFIELWEGERTSRQMRGILRSAVSHEAAARMMREFLTQEVLMPIAAATGRTQPEVRASLAASQLIGLAMARYVLGVQPLASLSHDELVAYVGPTFQRYLTGTLPSPAQG
ncbi:TetR family transcriptional regulator [Streptomyces taklimakanensis]|uniref:TetR/AcrR family transcriptional regulator n=1 Tax=Streptomyces taklimakanensis TaxID=2569853 RepID=UPI003083F6A4